MTKEQFTQDPRNARVHGEQNKTSLLKSLDELGGGRSIVVDKNGICIGGNATLEQAEALGMKLKPVHTNGEELVVVVRDDLSTDDMRRKALAIADNRITDLGEFDQSELNSLLEELVSLGGDMDLDCTGFDEAEIEEAMTAMGGGGSGGDEPPTPEPPAVPKTELGRMYQLGRHKLMCGDSTSKKDVAKLMDGEKADMVFTDPPYGMNAVSKSGVLSKNYDGDIMGDDDNTVAVRSFQTIRSLGIAKQVWWGANYYSSALPDAECWIVWDKNNGGSDQTDAELAWTNMRSVVRMFTQASEKKNRVHPTQKPVSLAVWTFGKFDAGDIVLDVFGGSGSTLMACEQTGRSCCMMELDARYCDVIVERYCTMVGADPEEAFANGSVNV